MSTYTGRLHMSGVVDRPLGIYLDLDQESLAMWTYAGEEIGEWPLDAVQITFRGDGFTFRIGGEAAWVRTDDDGAFATEVGLQWAPPLLRRADAIPRTCGRTAGQFVEIYSGPAPPPITRT